MAARKHLKGGRVGRLMVMEELSCGRVVCLCDCGKQKEINRKSISAGYTKSCGCLQKETMRRMKTTHGMRNTTTYKSWASMLSRCRNPKDTRFQSHGGRGIKVCKRWSDSFQDFLKDMGERPQGRSLDRICNDGNYEPDNCRWATPREQANNTTKNKNITYNGITQSISAWARDIGTSQSSLSRSLISGLSFEDALKNRGVVSWPL